MLKAAILTFPVETGLGVDAMQPRAILRLSDDSLRALCTIMMAAELHGCWPEVLRTVLIVSFPRRMVADDPLGCSPRSSGCGAASETLWRDLGGIRSANGTYMVARLKVRRGPLGCRQRKPKWPPCRNDATESS